MKRIIYIHSAIYMILVSVSLAQAPVNPNGGFEESHVGSYTKAAQGIDGWYIWHTQALPPMDAEFYVVDNPVAEGQRCMKVLVNKLGTLDYHIQTYNEPIPVEQNTYYRYSVWMLVDRDSLLANFTVGLLNSQELRRVGAKPLVTDWQKVSFVFYSGINDFVRTPIHFALAKNENKLPGTFYIDDLRITKSSLAISEVNMGGDTLKIQLGWGIENLASNFNPNAFKINVNGVANPISFMEQKGQTLNFKLTNKVKQGETVKISYDSTIAKIAYGPDESKVPTPRVASFVDENVENLVGAKRIITAIEQPLELAKINLYPNPVQNILTVTGLENAKELEIRSISGHQIKLINLQYVSETAVDVSQLERGLYIVNIYTKRGAKRTMKFIK